MGMDNSKEVDNSLERSKNGVSKCEISFNLGENYTSSRPNSGHRKSKSLQYPVNAVDKLNKRWNVSVKPSNKNANVGDSIDELMNRKKQE